MPRLRNWPHTQGRFSLEETIGGGPMPTISVPEGRPTTARVIRGLWNIFRSRWALVLDRTSEATNPEIANDGEPDGYSRDTSQNHSRISLRKKCSVRAWRSVGFFIMQHQGAQLGDVSRVPARGYSKKELRRPRQACFYHHPFLCLSQVQNLGRTQIQLIISLGVTPFYTKTYHNYTVYLQHMHN